MFIPLNQRPSAELRPSHSRISANDWRVLADHWHPVSIAAEVGDRPLRVRLLDVDLVLFRGAGGTVGATLDICPHRHVRLSGGGVLDGAIVCPFHGLRFATDGRCLGAPSLGVGAKLPDSYRVRSFATVERYGLVWTCLGDASQRAVPELPVLSTLDCTEFAVAASDWPVSAPRQIENFFDLAHLPLVHAKTLGGDVRRPIRPGRIDDTADAVVLTADYEEALLGGPSRLCTYIYRIVPPFIIDFEVRGPDGFHIHSWNMASPTTAHASRVFQFLRIDRSVDQQVVDHAGLGIVNGEDMAVLSTLMVPDMPLDQHHEIHLPVDNVCNAYRGRLRLLGLGR